MFPVEGNYNITTLAPLRALTFRMKKHVSIILFVIIALQIGCLSSLLEPRNDDPKFLLGQDYFVSLDATWTTEQASKLLKIFRSISPDEPPPASVWKISDVDLENDIKVEAQIGLRSVTISRDVFVVDASQSATISKKRLFKAAVQFITGTGTNRPAIKRILHERYGITVDVSSVVRQSVMLPAYATRERTSKAFSPIDNEDLMIFISILEDFPQGLHKMPQLKYVVCRDEELGDGAAAKAWTSSGFIEFKKSFLDAASTSDIRRLFAHEKSHFLWTHLLPIQLKEDWIELGGWYEDKGSEEGWSTNKDRAGFVTNYAFEKNPNEDMAESLAYYLVYPDRLRASNMGKYNFIHERIMLTYGSRYISPDMLSGR